MLYLYKKVGEMLLQEGIISNLELSIALAAQQTSYKRIGEILVERGFATEEQIAACLANQCGYNVVDPKDLNIEGGALELLNAEFALTRAVLPVAASASTLECVMADPIDVQTTDEIRAAVGRSLQIRVAPKSDLVRKIRQVYGLAADHSAHEGEPIRCPSRFKDARLIRKIGSLEVASAVDDSLARPVTLVAGPTASPQSESLLGRLRALASARTPYVCAVHDVFEAGPQTWIVLESLPGETLKSVLRTRGSRTVPQATSWMAMLAEAVDEISTKGYTANLLSSENVLVQDRGVFLLPLSEPAPSYAGPTPDRQILFAIGTLLWECVTGKQPHEDVAVEGGAIVRWSSPSQVAPNMPPALLDLIRNCLDPASTRFVSPIQVSHALRSYRWTNQPETANADSGDRSELLDVISTPSAPKSKSRGLLSLFSRNKERWAS